LKKRLKEFLKLRKVSCLAWVRRTKGDGNLLKIRNSHSPFMAIFATKGYRKAENLPEIRNSHSPSWQSLPRRGTVRLRIFLKYGTLKPLHGKLCHEGDDWCGRELGSKNKGVKEGKKGRG
jgi:hypothetical protein